VIFEGSGKREEMLRIRTWAFIRWGSAPLSITAILFEFRPESKGFDMLLIY